MLARLCEQPNGWKYTRFYKDQLNSQLHLHLPPQHTASKRGTGLGRGQVLPSLHAKAVKLDGEEVQVS